MGCVSSMALPKPPHLAAALSHPTIKQVPAPGLLSKTPISPTLKICLQSNTTTAVPGAAQKRGQRFPADVKAFPISWGADYIR